MDANTSLSIDSFPLGDWQTNCYVVARPGSDQCVIFDCGFEPDEMLDWIAERKLKPAALVLTHAHLDHIGGVDQALRRFGKIPLCIHEAEAEFCGDSMLNLSAMIGMDTTCTTPDVLLKDGQSITFAGIPFRVLHTPGHSPGGATFVHDASAQAIVGDTLFAQSIGRFDFPSSDVKQLRHSIFNVLMKLPDETRIYPGHGEQTTIGRERRSNPFVLKGF
jgi:hydroxyacylglutathione hydrolase